MKLAPKTYYRFLVEQNCDFFSGVPDSLLREFCSCAKDLSAPENFWISANEGAAVGMAIGQHLASGKTPVVYLQNSGLGNTLNPIASMADPLVYGIPMLLVIGWRGELGSGSQKTGEQLKDEPQHRKQGRVTLSWLDASGIPYEILPLEEKQAEAATLRLLDIAQKEQCPVAIVVRKNSFAAYTPEVQSKQSKQAEQSNTQTKLPAREDAIAELLNALPSGPVVSTTGMISRELFEQRELRGEGHEKDFLVVGAMGHASAIAQGLALALKAKTKQQAVYCFDGDGALLMHMGSLAISGLSHPQNLKNFKHVVLNNGAHDSVGGQPTVGLQLDIAALAKVCGYKWSSSCSSLDELRAQISDFCRSDGPALLEIRVRKGARKDLGRPTLSSQEIKEQYKKYLSGL